MGRRFGWPGPSDEILEKRRGWGSLVLAVPFTPSSANSQRVTDTTCMPCQPACTKRRCLAWGYLKAPGLATRQTAPVDHASTAERRGASRGRQGPSTLCGLARDSVCGRSGVFAGRRILLGC